MDTHEHRVSLARLRRRRYAHARRTFHELHENHRSQIAADALVFSGALTMHFRASMAFLFSVCIRSYPRVRSAADTYGN